MDRRGPGAEPSVPVERRCGKASIAATIASPREARRVLPDAGMTPRALLRLVLGSGLGATAAIACSNYVPPDVGTYGPPNGLANNKAPEPPPTGDDGGSGAGGEDGGGTATGADGGGGGAAPSVLCVTSGGTLVDGGACAVSFSTDIYPKMQATGTWGCASSSCHGGTQAPVLNGSTAASFYSVLASYKLADVGGVTYIDPCSVDPTKSAFACNTLSPSASGECGASMPLGTPMVMADQQAIATWVACGAPDN